MTAIDPAIQPGRRSRWAGTKPSHLLLLAGVLLFFAIFLIWPIVQVVATGFMTPDGTFTARYIGAVFQDPTLRLGLWNATLIALCTTALCLLISLPLAVLSVRYDFAGRGMLNGLLLVPLVLPPFVGAVGMRYVLGRFGPLTMVTPGAGETGIDWLGAMRFFGVVLVEALHLYPIMLLNLQASLANVDPAMQQAASNLGAGRIRTFFRITLPLIRPGLFAGSTLVLIWSFTELGTPLMFDFNDVTPVQVFRRIAESQGNPLPYALVVVMLMASVLLYIIGKVLLGRGFEAATTKASTAAAPRRLGGVMGLLAALPFVIVFVMAVLPHMAVLLTSVSEVGAWYKSVLPTAYTTGHYAQALADPLVYGSIRNSLLYASCATLLAVMVGLAIAILIVRTNVPGRGLVDGLAMLPLAVPGLVLAFGYLSISIAFKRWFPEATSRDGSFYWLDVQEFPVILLIVAYASRRVPYVVRSAVAGLQQTPRDLELAASNLGAGKWRTLRKITVPLIVANLMAGALLAFTFCILEVSDSLILAQRDIYFPVTKAIYDLSQRLGDGYYVACALGVWAMLLLTFGILSASSLMSKRLGAIFRV